MARYERSYTGEHRSRSVGFKLTPSERADLESDAAAAGFRLSDYLRQICLRRRAPVVAATRRNPDAKALLFELSAIGNNLNQLTHRSHISGKMPERAELHETLSAVKKAMARVLDL